MLARHRTVRCVVFLLLHSLAFAPEKCLLDDDCCQSKHLYCKLLKLSLVVSHPGGPPLVELAEIVQTCGLFNHILNLGERVRRRKSLTISPAGCIENSALHCLGTSQLLHEVLTPYTC